MSSTERETVEEVSRSQRNSVKWFKNPKIITSGVVVIVLLLAGLSYYQATRFNSHVMINDTQVGGLTVEKAIKKLKTAVLNNSVYVGQEKILDEEDTKLGFSEKDLPEIKKLLKKQWTFFPSTKEKNYWLIPEEADQYRNQTMKKHVKDKLLSMNKSLKAPVDAQATLKDGQIVITKSMDGKQYDIASLMKDYEKQVYRSEIHLKPVLLQPVKEDSEIVKKEEKKLQEIQQQSIDYKVQDKVYSLAANELVKNAAVSKEMKVTIDPSGIQDKIDEINRTQSTLDKDFTFKTHSGRVISVKGKGYGWALDTEKEAARIQKAFEKGEAKPLSASNIRGHGWNGEGYGYETTTNNGIGDTYAEVSIAEQRAWIYKNGKLAVTTHVVTGKHITGEDTSKGVWYILYKRQQYTLRGSSAGSPGSYAIKVNYWAPFTNSGQGFHDASWRSNWRSSAYIAAGSGGCVNTPPSIMGTVYNTLSTYDPVVIY
ncbi:L,D-transpeptidase family protein [Neobacillus mesonae]|uniref:L,D-transpeptidase family protein n=1 Tax=Neobacillus mesonae TaxID=1193713 RepID=UPI00203B5376|nr:L,D-transpeptidase family protein [Neobacillus mesonae]MCM3569783.1 L,D-transpeptidase/peptidoglycan binding protein [Neobacillus mesonae]